MTNQIGTKPPLALLCATSSWGGLEMNVLRLAKRLAERDWPVLIYGDPDSRLGAEATSAGLPVRPTVQTPGLFGQVAVARRLSKTAQADKIGWLITNLSHDRLPASLARQFSGSSFRLAHLQHMHLGANKRDPVHNWQYRRFDAWVVPLPMFKSRVAQATVIPETRIHVIPFGIETEQFTDRLPSRIRAREQLGLPREAVVVGNVARLDPKKGQDTLIEAVAGLHHKGQPAHLLLVGDRTAGEAEDFESQVSNMITDKKLDGFVHRKSFMTDIAIAYAAMDIFVLASHSETYGMVTVEAMASGLPVVATAEGGTVEIVTDGVTGRLFSPQASEELRDVLSELLSHPEQRERLGHAARQEARTRFDYRVQISAMEKVLTTRTV